MNPRTPKPAAAAKPSAFDYAAAKIATDVRKQLEAKAEAVKSLGRKSTEQAFNLGELILEAAELLGPENPVGKWAAATTGLNARTTRLYSSVASSIGHLKEQCVELGISPTVLFELPSATEEQRQAILQLAREAGSIKVREAKAIIAGDSEQPVLSEDPLHNGGADGLKAIAAATSRTMIASVLRHLAEIILAITAARSEKRVQKGKLVEQVDPIARKARMELSNLLQPVADTFDFNRHAELVRLPEDAPWAKVAKLLLQLSSQHTWPDSKLLDAWLDGEVLPTLAWATSKSSAPEWTIEAPTTVVPFRPVAVIDAATVVDADADETPEEIENELDDIETSSWKHQ